MLVSNCLEVRLCGFGRGRDAYELFNLTRIDDPDQHARLWLILSAERLLGDATETLLRETDNAYKDVTNKLYDEYKAMRDKLIAFLVDPAGGDHRIHSLVDSLIQPVSRRRQPTDVRWPLLRRQRCFPVLFGHRPAGQFDHFQRANDSP